LAVTAAFAVVGAGAVAVTQGLSSGASDNLIDYSGFRYGSSGWAIAATDAIDIVRTSPGAFGSEYALELASRGEVDIHMEDGEDLPRAVAGEGYLGVVYVKSALPGVAGTLAIRELNSGTVVDIDRSPFTTRAAWTRVVVTHKALAGDNELLISLDIDDMPGGNPVVVDNLRMVVDTPAGSGVTDPPTGGGTDPSAGGGTDPSAGGGTDPSAGGGTDPSAGGGTTSPPSGGGTTSPPSGGGTSSPPGANPETLFGASVDQGARTWTEAVADSDALYGRLDVVRVFYQGMPSGWPGRAGAVDRPVVVSFKAMPQEVLTGALDDELRQWFATAPRGRDIWWSYWHEPEDNVAAGDFTAQQWREAYRRIAGLAQEAQNPMLHSTAILMCWTASPKSGRSVSDFFPGRDVVDTLGWDCYNLADDSYNGPAMMFDRIIQISRDYGVDFGIAELGSKIRGTDDGTLRAVWLRQVAEYLAQEGAQFVTYFDNLMPGGEFRLLDQPSQLAWRDAVAW
jgi:hypothetical protein